MRVLFLGVFGNFDPVGGAFGNMGALDEFEKMGFGCATPISFNRSANAAPMASGPDGSVESARMA